MSEGRGKKNLKYTIGHFASILGLTTDTIRLYEKHDIVCPQKNDHNHYRYFNDLDARNLLMSRWFRSAEIPLQETAALVNESSSACILHSFEESRRNIQLEIDHKQRLLNRITEIMNQISEAEHTLYQCKIKEQRGFYRIKQTNKNELLPPDGLQEIVSQWMDCLPFLFYSFRIENAQALLEEGHLFEYNWGISLPENEVKFIQEEWRTLIEYIPPAICLSSYINLNQDDDIAPQHLKHMADQLLQEGHTTVKDIVGKIIFVEKTNQQSKTFMEVNIPISEIEVFS